MDVDGKKPGRSTSMSRPSTRAASVPPVVIDAAQLFQGGNEIALRHGDAIYRLKITRFGKLILNK